MGLSAEEVKMPSPKYNPDEVKPEDGKAPEQSEEKSEEKPEPAE